MTEFEKTKYDYLIALHTLQKLKAKSAKDPLIKEMLSVKSTLTFLQIKQIEDLHSSSI